MIQATVRAIDNYQDGNERHEIHMSHDEGRKLPFQNSLRVEIPLFIDGVEYSVGLRKTKDCKYCWICPDAHKNGKKVRLSDITKSLGYKRNDPIQLKFDGKYISIFSRDEYQVQLPEEVPADLYEGAKTSITINSYERSSSARTKCIDHYGYTCSICGFDSEVIYGEEAAGIIHVHHIVPISEISKEYVVDPIKDLRPVCPNCHAVIHRNGKCDTLENVKNMLKPTCV